MEYKDHSVLEGINTQLCRIGVDARTLGTRIRGVRALDAGGGLVALFEGQMGPMYVSRPQSLLERLQPLPGGKGATDGVAWFWKVFLETVEPVLDRVVERLVTAVREGERTDVMEAMAALHALGVTTEYHQEGELGEEVQVGRYVSVSHYDTTYMAPEENWDELRERCMSQVVSDVL